MKMVSGLFDRYSLAEWALEVLEIYGVNNNQISVVARGRKSVSHTAATAEFVEMGFTKEEAELYAQGVNQGNFLITVATDSQHETLIRGILRSAGAVDKKTSSPIWQSGNAHVLNPNIYIQGD